MKDRHLKLTVAYDGTGYHGFQRQTNGMSIQQVLEEKLATLFGHSLNIMGAGRTDQGVHALEQVIHFTTTGSIPVERIPLAAKGVLPADIVVTGAEAVTPDFHAIKSATSKCYCYKLYLASTLNPFVRNYAWQLQRPLDLAAMEKAAVYLTGEHNFSSFCAAGGSAKTFVRNLYSIWLVKQGAIVEWRFWGNGFLYHMVRNLMGTLVEVGFSRRSPEDMSSLLAARDRHQAGATAPAHGLYLERVYYGNEPVNA